MRIATGTTNYEHDGILSIITPTGGRGQGLDTGFRRYDGVGRGAWGGYFQRNDASYSGCELLVTDRVAAVHYNCLAGDALEGRPA